MSKDIFDIMLNPTRLRIIQAIAYHRRRTTNEICESMSDVPRATLYRHISILIGANVINVIDEKKVRGSVERTLSIMPMNGQEFEQFLSELTSLFMKYHFEMAGGRKLRDISVISAPPEDNISEYGEDEDENE